MVILHYLVLDFPTILSPLYYTTSFSTAYSNLLLYYFTTRCSNDLPALLLHTSCHSRSSLYLLIYYNLTTYFGEATEEGGQAADTASFSAAKTPILLCDFQLSQFFCLFFVPSACNMVRPTGVAATRLTACSLCTPVSSRTRSPSAMK